MLIIAFTLLTHTSLSPVWGPTPPTESPSTHQECEWEQGIPHVVFKVSAIIIAKWETPCPSMTSQCAIGIVKPVNKNPQRPTPKQRPPNKNTSLLDVVKCIVLSKDHLSTKTTFFGASRVVFVRMFYHTHKVYR